MDGPGDISVASFDGHPLAELWSPPLTTVKQDFVGLGRRGFQLLQKRWTKNLPLLLLGTPQDRLPRQHCPAPRPVSASRCRGRRCAQPR
ncbi:substrate-binding domain-containing protein [Glycomyces sp. YM15]|uniref:substrate-binding domain-containing protein n=1 Tax=Glycomyces sp. YM15 TaxID=2800446 RepID=UPI001964EC63